MCFLPFVVYITWIRHDCTLRSFSHNRSFSTCLWVSFSFHLLCNNSVISPAICCPFNNAILLTGSLKHEGVCHISLMAGVLTVKQCPGIFPGFCKCSSACFFFTKVNRLNPNPWVQLMHKLMLHSTVFLESLRYPKMHPMMLSLPVCTPSLSVVQSTELKQWHICSEFSNWLCFTYFWKSFGQYTVNLVRNVQPSLSADNSMDVVIHFYKKKKKTSSG